VSTPDDLTSLLAEAQECIRPEPSDQEPWFEDYCRLHRVRIAEDLGLVRKHLAPGSGVLEIGSVPLLTTAVLKKLGYRVRGVDLEPDRFSGSIERLELDVRKCDVESESLPFETHRFDGVLFSEIFEHLRLNPISTLEEVYRVLKPGGKLLLATPNLFAYRRLVGLIRTGVVIGAEPFEQYRKLETVGHMGHVRIYSAAEVRKLLAAIGFEPTETIYCNRATRGWTPRALAARVLCSIFPALRAGYTVVALKPPAVALRTG
jgi:SAM-dependent methyltransferase